MEGSTGAVSGLACHDNGRWSVADPRMPGATDQLVAVIRALDDTWHRPFTTLELAALQSLVDPEEFLSWTAFQTAHGANALAMPCHAMPLLPSLASWAARCCWQRQGRPSCSGNMPIWVRPVAIGLSVMGPTP